MFAPSAPQNVEAGRRIGGMMSVTTECASKMDERQSECSKTQSILQRDKAIQWASLSVHLFPYELLARLSRYILGLSEMRCLAQGDTHQNNPNPYPKVCHLLRRRCQAKVSEPPRSSRRSAPWMTSKHRARKHCLSEDATLAPTVRLAIYSTVSRAENGDLCTQKSLAT